MCATFCAHTALAASSASASLSTLHATATARISTSRASAGPQAVPLPSSTQSSARSGLRLPSTASRTLALSSPRVGRAEPLGQRPPPPPPPPPPLLSYSRLTSPSSAPVSKRLPRFRSGRGRDLSWCSQCLSRSSWSPPKTPPPPSRPPMSSPPPPPPPPVASTARPSATSHARGARSAAQCCRTGWSGRRLRAWPRSSSRRRPRRCASTRTSSPAGRGWARSRTEPLPSNGAHRHVGAALPRERARRRYRRAYRNLAMGARARPTSTGGGFVWRADTNQQTPACQAEMSETQITDVDHAAKHDAVLQMTQIRFV
mmetsp:Transcript_42530/g.85310  ORF Transcript_42530/g.85310 Transcript_42530/m.85310 type:complete len:315 (+) Transcript_42530:227-1171(+)